MNGNWNRRQFLKIIGQAGLVASAQDPLAKLLGAVVDGVINRAEAAETGVEPRRYVNFYLSGGPARWFFDLPMDPLNSGNFQRGHMMTGCDSAGNPEFRTVPITAGGKTYHMPALWASQIPTSDGGFAPMGELLANMLIVRGIEMGGGDHSIIYRLLRPVSDAPSLDGAVADASSLPLAAASMFPALSYRSMKGKGLNVPKNGNIYGTNDTNDTGLHRMVSPFLEDPNALSASFMQRRQALEAGIQAVLGTLKTYASSSRPGADALYSDRKNAEDLIRSGLTDLSATWISLVAKYRSLMARTNDVARFLPNVIPHDAYCRNGKTNPLNPDLRTMIHAGVVSEMFAEHLAVTEFLLTRNLSSSVTINNPGIYGLKQEGTEEFTDDQNDSGRSLRPEISHGSYSGDEHFTRPKYSTVASSSWYYGLATGINELVRALKAKGIFNETVIQISSEFSRNLRADRVGSDHAASAGVLTLISGAIKKPLILGNIVATPGVGYSGTHGPGAKVRLEGQDVSLTWDHAISTAAALLRVPSPSANFGSVVKEINGQVTALIGEPENKNI